MVVRDFDVDLPNLQVLTLGQGDRSKLDMQLTRPHPSVKRLYGRQFHENAVQSLQHFPNMDYLDLPYLRNMNLIKFGWMPKLRELVVNLMFLNDRLDNGDEDIVQDDEDDITSITEKLEFICHFSKSLETVSINNVDDLAPFSCLSQLKELVVLEVSLNLTFMIILNAPFIHVY